MEGREMETEKWKKPSRSKEITKQTQGVNNYIKFKRFKYMNLESGRRVLKAHKP